LTAFEPGAFPPANTLSLVRISLAIIFFLQIDLPRFYLQSLLITTYVFVPEFTRGRSHKLDLFLLAMPIEVVSLAHPSTWIVGREKEYI